MQCYPPCFVSSFRFVKIDKCFLSTLFGNRLAGISRKVIDSKYGILRKSRDKVSGGGFQNIFSGSHNFFGFLLCRFRKRDMDRHLVTVEVRVKRCAHERWNLNRKPLNKKWFKSLNA